MPTSTHSPGALVRARGRDWVVMPADEQDVLLLRPVDGTDEDAVGIYLPIEGNAVDQAHYPAPDPEAAGDFAGGLLLRDAARLSLRSGAGPFRSMGRLSVKPRPYQFVPLIMALRQDVVRLLIADDVGVGKTIEAAMVARELMDRGIVRRIGVVCAPHLCEQWEQELREKFNIETVVVQPSRMARLERDLPRPDVGVFGYYRHLVASIDFVKSRRYRRAFVDNAPDLIIVDEAHTSARPRSDRGSYQHQRFEFLQELMQSPERHLILCTATPHSGIEESFRSLLGLLDSSFDLPIDIEIQRSKLVPHLVQRKRADLESWLGEDTPFPIRESEERTYQMSAEYLKLFDNVLSYCRESVTAADGKARQQRVRYWAATAILRCVLSSPAAAEAMLEKRAQAKRDAAEPAEESLSEESFRSQILDGGEEDEPSDYVPRAPLDDPAADLTEAEVRKLDGFLKIARSLAGPELDQKLNAAGKAVDQLLKEGFFPIVYCRFIATANYVAEQLQASLAPKHRGLRVVSVTGGDGNSDQRAEIVDDLSAEPVRVLVATDCLSEGVNLQEHFNAVVHYDLPWNPNRLEQREGRVDRYGQPRKTVKAVLLYGADNPIDQVVLDVLIRKARTIRRRMGIAVPVPVESEHVVQAVIDSVLLIGRAKGKQMRLGLDDPEVSSFHAEWDEAADREGKARTYFAQHGIKPDEVARELEEIEPALGSVRDVKRFVANAIQRFNGELRDTKEDGVFELHPGDLAEGMALRSSTVTACPVRVSFDGVPPDGVLLLGRNHPIVATITDNVLARALSDDDPRFARSAAIFTSSVSVRTAVVVMRVRYLLKEKTEQFAEEVVLDGFRRAGDGLEWIGRGEALGLLGDAQPAANMAAPEREQHLTWALGLLDGNWFDDLVAERARAIAESHARLRSVVKAKTLKVDPHTPPDILGCYVLVPSGGGS